MNNQYLSLTSLLTTNAADKETNNSFSPPPSWKKLVNHEHNIAKQLISFQCKNEFHCYRLHQVRFSNNDSSKPFINAAVN